MSRRHPVLSSIAAALLVAACANDATETPPTPPSPPTTAEPPPSTTGEPAPTPCMPTPATRESLSVANDLGTFGGTLEVPETCARVPVVVIVSGSGSSDRDGNVPGDTDRPAIYRVLAESLGQAGIATFRYDDPGIGKSATAAPPRVEDFTFEVEIDGVARIVRELRKDARFDRVVTAGHSQGSLTAILAAEREPVDGFLSLAGAGRPIGRVIHDQAAPRMTAEELARMDAAIARLEKGERIGPQTAPLDTWFPEAVQPYLISWMKYDPKAEIAKLKAPALVLQGRMDLQVSEGDATLLHEGKTDATLVFVDDMGHMLRQVSQKTSTAQRASYSQALPLHPKAVEAMTTLVKALPAK